jgi:hypothetical protein
MIHEWLLRLWQTGASDGRSFETPLRDGCASSAAPQDERNREGAISQISLILRRD